MVKHNGGSNLTQIAVPAALFYANQMFSANRRKPVPATFKKSSFRRKRSTRRNFRKSKTFKRRT